MSAGELIVAGVVGYVLGTFPSADLATRLATRGAVDLRSAGSGNPGATNAAKVLGTAWGLGVLMADVAKGVVAGFAGMAIAGDAGGYVAAATSVVGHIFPVWSRFRGGKGVATSAGACLAVFPAYFPIDLAVAAIGAVAARRAERATQIAAAVWVGAAAAWWLGDLPNAWGPDPSFGLVAFATASTTMILGKFAHSARRADAERGEVAKDRDDVAGVER
jgi:glycerol-3-phosphate acyltransferase PlsY